MSLLLIGLLFFVFIRRKFIDEKMTCLYNFWFLNKCFESSFYIVNLSYFLITVICIFIRPTSLSLVELLACKLAVYGLISYNSMYVWEYFIPFLIVTEKKKNLISINLHFVEYNIIILGVKFIKKILILVIVIPIEI